MFGVPRQRHAPRLYPEKKAEATKPTMVMLISISPFLVLGIAEAIVRVLG